VEEAVMAGKISFLVGLGAGYVLGARAGRERYEQISQKAQGVWHDPRVQRRADQAQQVVKDKAGDASAKVAEKANEAGSKVAEKVSEKVSEKVGSDDSSSGAGSSYGTGRIGAGSTAAGTNASGR
jgi:hypothetical protein